MINPAHVAASALGNVTHEILTDVLSEDEKQSLSTNELLEIIRRINVAMLAELRALTRNEQRSYYLDSVITLGADMETDITPFPYSFVSVWVPALTNAVLRIRGYADIAVALPANKFTTLQAPRTVYICLPTGAANNVGAIMRHSDIQYGSILP